MSDFYTIGHGRLPVDAFATLLRRAEVELLVDVRTVPRSRANPQFNKDVLPGSLTPFGIEYEHAATLGGLRGRQFEGPSPNRFWENASFRNYADYAMTEPFRDALERLRAWGRQRRCAVMCAESVWWRCHRRIIADYLLVAGEKAFHLMGDGRIDHARMTQGAVVRHDGSLIYPARGQECGNM